MAESHSDVKAVPSEADEARFWALVESAWEGLGDDANTLRRALVDRNPTEDDEDGPYAIDSWLEPLLQRLRDPCADLTSRDLTDLDRVLERRLYEIDRADIQEVTDGSDEGFLYCRGFIVALGREFYEAVAANPAFAVLDAGCEAMCYFFAHLHQEKFGTWPETGSGISRETGSNRAAWSLA